MADGVLLQSHTYGGVALLWYSSSNHLVSPCKHFSSRACAVKVKVSNMTCILIYVYLPNDNFSSIPSDNLSDTINELETFMHSFNDVHFILGGDLNTDFS